MIRKFRTSTRHQFVSWGLRSAIAVTIIFISPTAIAAAPAVREYAGNIQYRGSDAKVRQITGGGNFSEPVLSPDGRTIAFVHLDGQPTTEGESGFTSLWIADVATGTTRRLLASKPDIENPKQNMASFQHPRFSLDGGYIYVDADAWMTSPAVHQVSVTTGKERFVIDGSLVSIIRTGPYRGYLLVSRHKYRSAPLMGSYDPVDVVRPDAKETFMVPGSDQDDGERSVPAWLAAKGWKAW